MKNITVSLFLSAIGLDQYKASASRASALTDSNGSNVLESLMGAQLDLDSFTLARNKDEDDDEDDLSDDEFNQEEADIKIELKHEVNQEGNPSYNRHLTNQGSPAIQDHGPQDKNLIGRDENGHFKNHQNFLKLRNKINEQEQGHSDMFDKIDDKLEDPEFFEQVLQINEMNMEKVQAQEQDRTRGARGAAADTSASAAANTTQNATSLAESAAQNKLSSTAEGGMSDADVKCYTDRYGDVQGDPREHYANIGQREGRLQNCAIELSEYQAQKYIDRHPDMQNKFGRGGKYAQTMATENYTDYGFAQKKNIEYEDWDQPWFCGEIDPRNPGYSVTCGCQGRLWMGHAKDPLTGKRLEDLTQMRQWNTSSKVVRDWTDCSIAAIGGGDPAPLKKKQCFCEVTPQEVPTRCALDGGNCMCNGAVFYGQLAMEGSGSDAWVDFWGGSQNQWTAQDANNTGNVTCEPKTFEGIDPLPGVDKQCFCDEHWHQIDGGGVSSIKEYWRGWRWQMEAQERQRLAVIEQERLRIEAEAAAAAAFARAQADRLAQEESRRIAKEQAEAARRQAEAQAKAQAEAERKRRQAAEMEMRKRREEQKRREEERIRMEREAEEAERKAEAEKDARVRRELMEKAKIEKQRAVQAAVAEAIAQQRAEAEAEIERIRNEQEQQRIESERKRRIAEALEQSQQEEAERVAQAARDEERAARQASRAQQREATAMAAQAALNKAVAEAMEKQRLAYEEKERRAQEKADREQKQKEEREAKLLAQRQKEEKAAEIVRLAAEKEAREKKEAARIALEESRKKEREEIAEKRRLDKEAYEKSKAEKKARDAKLQAQRAEELAKTQEDVKAAQEKSAAASKAFELAQKERQRVLDEKAKIEQDLLESQASARRAQEAEDAALAQQQEAEDTAAAWAKKAEEAKLKAAKDMAKAQEEKKKHAAKLEEERKEAKAKQQAQLLAQKASFEEADKAAKLAAEKAEAERLEIAKSNKAEHEKKMALRRAEFQAQMNKNLWATGHTGIALAYFTCETLAGAESLISRLFKDTLIADVEEYKEDLNRAFLSSNLHAMIPQTNLHKIVMVTSDERVPELIETVARYNPNKEIYPAFDLVVSSMATGSQNYIEWVKLQTIKKDYDTNFFGQNNDPYVFAPQVGALNSNGTNQTEADLSSWTNQRTTYQEGLKEISNGQGTNSSGSTNTTSQASLQDDSLVHTLVQLAESTTQKSKSKVFAKNAQTCDDDGDDDDDDEE